MKPEREPTHFLNVDLEIFSTLDLAPLLAVWGESVFVLHSDRVKRTYHVFLEIGRIPKSADQQSGRYGTAPANAISVSASRLV